MFLIDQVCLGQDSINIDSLGQLLMETPQEVIDYCDSILLVGGISQNQKTHVYMLMGDAAYYLEDIRLCHQYGQLALREISDDFPLEKKAELYNNLGQTSDFLGSLDSALIFYKTGITIAKQAGDSIKLSQMYFNIGVTNFVKTDYYETLVYFDSAFQVDYILQDSTNLSHSLKAVASMQSHYGDLELAEENLLKALDYVTDEHPAQKCVLYFNLGTLSLRKKELAKTRMYIESCKSCYKSMEDQTTLNYYYDLEGAYNQEIGELNKAILFYDSAINHANLVGDVIEVMRTHFKKTLIDPSKINVPEFMSMLEKAKAMKSLRVLATGYEVLQKKYVKEKRYDLAYAYRDSIESIFDQFDDDKNRAITYKQSSGFKLIRKENEIALGKEKLKSQRLQWVLIAVIISLVFILILVFLYFRSKRDKLKILKDKLEKEAELNRQIVENESKALRAQMNPHFMFNALNSIKGLVIGKRDKEAALYISKFSKLIRSVLENSREQLITLDNEINTLGIYIELEKLRFRDGFKYAMNVSDDLETENICIPPMVIQPFVENAIWHGFKNNERENSFYVSMRKIDGQLSIQVSDNGVGRVEADSRQKNDHRSYGTDITAERINHFANDDLKRITYKDLTDDENGEALGTVVTLLIPLKHDRK